jgi:hypothetical protein
VKPTHTDPELLERLRLAAQRPMTRKEVREQKISWVLGNLPFDSDATYDEIAAVIDKHERYAA